MSDSQTPDYKYLLARAGAPDLSDDDVADLKPGLRAIDGKIAALRALSCELNEILPDPLDTAGACDA